MDDSAKNSNFHGEKLSPLFLESSAIKYSSNFDYFSEFFSPDMKVTFFKINLFFTKLRKKYLL